MMLKYSEYIERGGTVLSEAAFLRYEYRAEKEINRYTQGRLCSVKPSETLKRCVCEIVETIIKAEAGNNNVSSVSNDGMSVSYRDTSRTETELSRSVYKIVITYLPEYCYRGVD